MYLCTAMASIRADKITWKNEYVRVNYAIESRCLSKKKKRKAMDLGLDMDFKGIHSVLRKKAAYRKISALSLCMQKTMSSPSDRKRGKIFPIWFWQHKK